MTSKDASKSLNEMLGKHRRQTQQIRLQFGLGLSTGIRDGRMIWIVDAQGDGKRLVNGPMKS